MTVDPAEARRALDELIAGSIGPVRLLILNGVNLDMLGRRDPTVYCGLSIAELESRIYQWGRSSS